jgi:Xaa-Pro aminopeptidase
MKKNHLERLKRLKKALEYDGFLIQNPVDLFYFTGLELSAGKLLVLKDAAWLLVDGRYIESAKERSPISVKLDKPNLLLEMIPKGSKIGIDSEKTSLQNYMDLQTQWKKAAIHPKPEKGVISRLREIKDSAEIELLRKAATLGSLGYDHVANRLKTGITEKELADSLEQFWKKRGAQGVAFDPIIAFGPNSSKPHYRAGDVKLESNQHVLIDIGVTLNHYHSDMTRVVFKGRKQKKIVEIYDLVAEAHLRAKKLAKSGASIASLDAAARDYISSKGYGDYFSHSLGHGIGLEVHEAPALRSSPLKLKKGMVITIEPGIYLPGLGGVRIEDTYLILEKGCESLTQREF